MKVYLVLKHIPYEGFDIIRVYGDIEMAWKHVELLKPTDGYCEFDVEEHDVVCDL